MDTNVLALVKSRGATLLMHVVFYVSLK